MAKLTDNQFRVFMMPLLAPSGQKISPFHF